MKFTKNRVSNSSMEWRTVKASVQWIIVIQPPGPRVVTRTSRPGDYWSDLKYWEAQFGYQEYTVDHEYTIHGWTAGLVPTPQRVFIGLPVELADAGVALPFASSALTWMDGVDEKSSKDEIGEQWRAFLRDIHPKLPGVAVVGLPKKEAT